MRRAHSVHEMKEYLKLRAQNPDDAAAVLQRLKEQNYIDDARYARDYARTHAQGRRQGKFRIARELRARGVADRHIEAALEAVFAETDENALVRARLERKLRRLRGPLDERKRAAIYQSLVRAGFSTDAIRAELRAAVKHGTAQAGEDGEIPGSSDGAI
jgi:regulatory protein